MTTLWRKLKSPFSEFGFFGGLLYGIDEVLRRSGSRFRLFCYEIMVQPVSTEPLAPASLTRKVSVREIPQGDPLLDEMPPPKTVIDDRFDQNAVCLAAFKADSILGYQWVCFGPYDEDEVRCTFVPDPSDTTVFDFDFYVYPAHRFGIGFVALWDGTNAYLRERGIEFSCSRVSYFNTASRKSHDHLKWKRVGLTTFLRGRSWQLMIGTVAPYLHISFGETARPRVKIPTGKFDAL